MQLWHKGYAGGDRTRSSRRRSAKPIYTEKLLSIKNLTFAEACDVARSLEAAEANSKEISSALSKETNATGAAATVQLMARRQSGFRPPSKELRPFSSGSQQQQQPCYRCGRQNHTPKDCKFAEATCYACGKQGHIAPASRSRLVSKKPGGPPTPRRRSKIHKVKAEVRTAPLTSTHTATTDNASKEEEELFLYAVGQQSSKKQPPIPPIRYQLYLDGKPLWLELDTGAEVSILLESTWKSNFPNKPLLRVD